MTNPVSKLLRVEYIALDCDVSSREMLLERLAPMLVRSRRPNQVEVLDGLTAREKLGSTGVGHGIAIPHARISECIAPAAALVRTRRGIPFGAPDGKSVWLFLGLILPTKTNQQHLKLLATAAAMLNDPWVRERVLSSPSPAATVNSIASWVEPSGECD